MLPDNEEIGFLDAESVISADAPERGDSDGKIFNPDNAVSVWHHFVADLFESRLYFFGIIDMVNVEFFYLLSLISSNIRLGWIL